MVQIVSMVFQNGIATEKGFKTWAQIEAEEAAAKNGTSIDVTEETTIEEAETTPVEEEIPQVEAEIVTTEEPAKEETKPAPVEKTEPKIILKADKNDSKSVKKFAEETMKDFAETRSVKPAPKKEIRKFDTHWTNCGSFVEGGVEYKYILFEYEIDESATYSEFVKFCRSQNLRLMNRVNDHDNYSMIYNKILRTEDLEAADSFEDLESHGYKQAGIKSRGKIWTYVWVKASDEKDDRFDKFREEISPYSETPVDKPAEPKPVEHIQVEANAGMFIIPNSADQLADWVLDSSVDAGSSIIEGYKKICKDNGIEWDPKEKFVQLWFHSKELESDNLVRHGFIVTIDGQKHHVDIDSDFEDLPLQLVQNLKEGDVLDLHINDVKVANKIVDFTLHVKAQQLGYRYQSFGTFEETLQQVIR